MRRYAGNVWRIGWVVMLEAWRRREVYAIVLATLALLTLAL